MASLNELEVLEAKLKAAKEKHNKLVNEVDALRDKQKVTFEMTRELGGKRKRETIEMEEQLQQKIMLKETKANAAHKEMTSVLEVVVAKKKELKMIESKNRQKKNQEIRKKLNAPVGFPRRFSVLSHHKTLDEMRYF